MAARRLPREFARLSRIGDPFLRRLAFVGILTKYLPPPAPIVVGGHAVEFYTLGSYATGDIDLIYPRPSVIGTLLTSWGFEQAGRHWVHPGLGLFVEVPNDMVEGADFDRVIETEAGGLPVRVIGPEDIIVDRLNAFVHWKSPEDGFWALELMRITYSQLDWKYLRARCKEETTLKALQALRRKARMRLAKDQL